MSADALERGLPPLRLYGSRVCLLDLSCWLIERPRALAFHLELPLPESAGKTTTRVEFESNTMNALTTLNTTTLTMSSREIAELLGCRHDSVKRTIDTLADKGLVTFTQTVEKGLGRPVTLYHVGKRDSYVIVAQLSPEFTAKLVDRWPELEAQVAAAPKVPQTFAEALRLAAEMEEQKEALRLQNEAMKPAATVGIAVSARKQTTIMDFARKLPGVNTNQVQNPQACLGYLYKDAKGKWVVRSQYREKLFSMDMDERSQGAYSAIVALEKGQQRLVDLYQSRQLPMKKGRSPVCSEELEAALETNGDSPAA